MFSLLFIFFATQRLAFAMLDQDQDGKVSLHELKKYLNDATRVAHVRQVMEQREEDSGSGLAVAVTSKEEELQEEEKDGEQSSGDHQSSGGGRGTLRQSSLDECFEVIDSDADGRMTFEEFVLLAHERGTLMGPLLEIAREIIIPLDVDDVVDESPL